MVKLRERKKAPRANSARGAFFNFYRLATHAGHVLGSGALLALHDVELHALAFAERLEARALNGRMMHEAILLAVLRRDEAKALLIVEPLYGTGRTHRPSPE